MLDRESTFADPEIIKLLQTRFIPVALDQAYQRRQKDTEGEFYRRIAGQGPRASEGFRNTTQGFYIAAADGKLLAYNNNRGPERIGRVMNEILTGFQPPKVSGISRQRVDERYNPLPPAGGLVLRVRAKVLDGYEPPTDPWRQIFQSALSRDNMWVSSREHTALANGQVTSSLAQRLARFHLVDNTRGEAPMWEPAEVRQAELMLAGGQLRGSVHLETANGRRGYRAQLLGEVESKNGKVTRFDCVAWGSYWGHGPFTGGAPAGKFPLAVSFTLADGSDTADRIPPQGSRGWVRGYLP